MGIRGFILRMSDWIGEPGDYVRHLREESAALRAEVERMEAFADRLVSDLLTSTTDSIYWRDSFYQLRQRKVLARGYATEYALRLLDAKLVPAISLNARPETVIGDPFAIEVIAADADVHDTRKRKTMVMRECPNCGARQSVDDLFTCRECGGEYCDACYGEEVDCPHCEAATAGDEGESSCR